MPTVAMTSFVDYDVIITSVLNFDQKATDFRNLNIKLGYLVKMTEPTKESTVINDKQTSSDDEGQSIEKSIAENIDLSGESSKDAESKENRSNNNSTKKSRVNRKFIVERNQNSDKQPNNSTQGKNEINFNNNSCKDITKNISTRSRTKNTNCNFAQLVEGKRRVGRPSKKITEDEIIPDLLNLKNAERITENNQNHRVERNSKQLDLNEDESITNCQDRTDETVTTPLYFSEQEGSSDSELEVSFRVRDEDLMDFEDHHSEDELDKVVERGRKRERNSNRSPKQRKRHRSKSRESYESKQLRREAAKRKEQEQTEKVIKKYKRDPILQQMLKEMVSEQVEKLKKQDTSENQNQERRTSGQIATGQQQSNGNASVRQGRVQPPPAQPSTSGYAPQARRLTGDFRQAAEQDQINRARSTADEAILQAERFKASIQTNQGNEIVERLRQLRYQDSEDDEFFHITCHIEAQLKLKIERGEFIELEKTLTEKPDFRET